MCGMCFSTLCVFVQFHLREFDLVFVFRDFKKTPIRIDAIPQKHLENLKAFLE